MSFFARTLFPNGGAGTYAITFPYIDKANVTVLDNGNAYTGTVSWPTASTVTLTPDISSAHTVEFKRVTPEGSPLVVFSSGALASGDLNLAETQLLYLEQEATDAVTAGEVGSGGVNSVNSRQGAVNLTAADVITGFGTQVAASLMAGTGISFSTTGGVTTIFNTGGGGGGGGAVSSVAGKTGAVTLVTGDIGGFGTGVASALAAGSNISLVTTGGITTVSATSPVSSVAGRTGAISLTAADVSSGFGTAVGGALAAGTNISLSSSGGVTTINASISGPVVTTSTYVGSTFNGNIGTASTTQAFPAGTNTGDLMVLVAYSGTATVPVCPAGWNTCYSGPRSSNSLLIAFKVMTVSDITTGTVTQSGLTGTSAVLLTAYRGPSNLTIGSSIGVSSAGVVTPVTIPGFTKSTANIGTLSLFLDGSGATGVTPPASPFTSRNGLGGPAFNIATADALSTSPYVSGTSISWAFTGGFQEAGMALELRNDGASGGSSGVTSVNSRTGVVTLSASDVSSGFGTAVAGVLLAGTNVSFSTVGGVTTISATAGGGGVSSVNTRTGAVSLTASDVSSGFGTAVGAALAAGAGVSLSTSAGVTTIAATGGGGGVPIGYEGADENGIKVSNSATTNTTNLNALIASMAAAGGGKIYFQGPGNYQINGSIVPKSFVDIEMADGAFLQWTAGGSSPIFNQASNTVLVHTNWKINLDEGSSYSGVMFNIHSAQWNNWDLLAVGSNAASTMAKFVADSTAGEFSWGGRNFVWNKISLRHRGMCGTGLFLSGIAASGSTYGAQAQGATDNTFYNCQFTNIAVRGIKIDVWSDSNTFAGNTYVGLSGSGSIGFTINEGRDPTPSCYNVVVEHMAVDTFGIGLSRTAVALFESKMIRFNQLFNDPQAENGILNSATISACLSYWIFTCDPGTNNMKLHTSGFSTVTP